MPTDAPPITAEDRAALRQLGGLQEQIFALQNRRWGALFYADHGANSQQEAEESLDEASTLERQSAALSEEHRALLQALRRRNPALVAWWAGIHAALFEGPVEGMESHVSKEACEHWRAVASGAKDAALDVLTQRGYPAQLREELARRLGL